MFARRWWPCAGVLIGSLALPLETPGAVLTFAFEGHIANKRDPAGKLTFADVGDTVTYTFSFDSSAPDADPRDGRGVYQGLAADVQVGPMLIECGAPTIEILHPSDYFNVTSSMMVQTLGFLPNSSLYFRLSDQQESNALPNASLPTQPYPLEPFRNRAFSLGFYVASPGGGSADLLALDPKQANAPGHFA